MGLDYWCVDALFRRPAARFLFIRTRDQRILSLLGRLEPSQCGPDLTVPCFATRHHVRAWYVVSRSYTNLSLSYIFYLVLGAIVVDRHRQVKASLADETNTPEASTSNRYKLASDIYTDVEVASNSLPSTFRCNIASTAPTAQPPSYVTRLPGGTVSPRTSSFLSEMSHWRRDVEMASLSGSSHMCTCHCHHHITPPPGIPEVGEEMRIHAARPQRHSNEF